jgi:DNA-binding MarR family transcriptional regulator
MTSSVERETPEEAPGRPLPVERDGKSAEMRGSSDLPAIWEIFGDEGFAQRLLLLAKMIERVTSRKLQEGFGLSVAQWRVLAFVCISGPVTASFIGYSAEVDPAEVSRAVKSLIERQLVTREFEAGSRKTMVVAPTASGRELFAKVRRKRQEYFSRVTKDLTSQAKAGLSDSLTSMVREVVAERSEAEAGRNVPPGRNN